MAWTSRRRLQSTGGDILTDKTRNSETCGKCLFFRGGNCMRFPPQVVSVMSAGASWQDVISRWPRVDEISHVCGEYVAR